MRKGLLFFLAAFITFALTLVSCSNDENLETADGSSIQFRTLVNKSDGLRAAITKETSILGFTVTGVKMNGGKPETVSPYLFNGFSISRGEDATGANSWEYTPARFWPKTGTVNFYAYSPASSKNVKKDFGLLNLDLNSGGRTSITYNVPIINTSEAQEDFLVARTTGLTASPVTLHFHHALSRVMFFARNEMPNVNYIVEKIELLNLYSEGNLDLTDSRIVENTGNLNYATPLVVWSPNTSSRINYLADMSETPVYLSNSFTTVLGKTNAIMVMPQTTTMPATDNTAPSSSQFAIKVYYRAFLDDVYYAGSETEPAIRYFKVEDPTKTAGTPLTFEMGRQYNFMLSFGHEVGDPIRFGVSLSDWNNEPVIHFPEYADYRPYLSNQLMEFAGLNKNAPITYAQLLAVKEITISGNNPTGSPDLRGLDFFPYLKFIILGNNVNYNLIDISKCPALYAFKTTTGSSVTTVIVPDYFNKYNNMHSDGGSYGAAYYANGDPIREK